MGGIGLCCEITAVVVATQTHIETLQVDVGASLGDESHTLRIVNGHILQTGVNSICHKQTWSRTEIAAHGHDGGSRQSAVFPMRSQVGVLINGTHLFQVEHQIRSAINNMSAFLLEGNTRERNIRPVIAKHFQIPLLIDAMVRLISHTEGNPFCSVVLHHLYLCYLRVGKVYRKMLDAALPAVQQGDG